MYQTGRKKSLKNLEGGNELRNFISDYFDEGRLYNLEPGHPICINAPPDSGKTTFVLQKICDCARRSGENVLLFVNRKALFGELHFKMLEVELEKEISDSGLQILEIQSTEGNSKRAQKLREEIKDYKYICVDECHYFVQDARFNPRTQVSFEFLTELLPSHIFFFLSATPGEFIALMNKKLDYMYQLALQKYEGDVRCYEERLDKKRQEFEDLLLENNPQKYGQLSCLMEVDEDFEKWKQGEQIFPPEKPVRIELEIFNEIAPDYSGVDIWHFRNLDDLIPRITQDKGNYLIFVNSKKEGGRIKKLLNKKFKEQAGIQKSKNRAVFVDSNYQSEQNAKNVVKKIIEQGKLKVKVLITTSVLDNGINILDHKLSNLVLTTFDDIDAIQMIGRKRLRDGERLNLYLPYGAAKFFSRQLRTVIHNYECVRTIANTSFSVTSDYLLGSRELLKLKDNFFYKNSEGRWNLGKISFFKLYRQYSYAKKILDGLEKDENFFLKHQYHLLGLELTEDDIVQKDVNKGGKRAKVETELRKIKEQDFPIIGKERFDILANSIISDFGEKNNAKPFRRLNKLLQELGLSEQFESMSLGNRMLYYLAGMSFPSLRDSCATKEVIASKIEFVQGDFQEVYQTLFVEDIPEIFINNADSLGKFVNETLKRRGLGITIQRKKNGNYEVREKSITAKIE